MRCATSLMGMALLMALAAPASAALVTDWDFEEGPGAVFIDDKATGFLGQVNGAAFVPSAVNGSTYAMHFDGIDDFILTNYGGVGGTTPRSVAFWMRSGASASNHGIVAWGDDGADGAKWHIRLNSNGGNGDLGAIRTEVQGGYQIGDAVLNDGEWHHVVSVFNGLNVANVLHFVDGELEAVSGTNPQGINTDNDPGNPNVKPVTIGRRTQGANDHYFPGLVDELKIYDMALSQNEIQSLYNAGLPVGMQSIINYDARFDPTPGDATWEDVGGFDPGIVNLNLDPGVTLNTNTGSSGALTGAAYSFDGTGAASTDNGVALDSPQDFNLDPTTGSATIETWFRPSDLMGQEVVYEFGGTTDGASLTLNNALLQFAVKDNAQIAGATAALNEAQLNEFIHAVAVLDLDNDELLLYVDGELLGGATGVTHGDWAGDDALALGGISNQLGAAGNGGLFNGLSGYGNFVGDIASLRVYNEALSADEVRGLFLANGQGAGVPEPASALLLGLAGLGLVRRRRRVVA